MPVQKTTPTTLKHAGGTYVVIPSTTIEAIQGPNALAILIYLLDRPADWVIRREHVRARFKIGKEGYAKALKELASLGLAWKEQTRDQGGQITSTQLCIAATPRSTSTDVQEQPGTTEKPENRTAGEIDRESGSPDGRENPTGGKTEHLHRTELLHRTETEGPAEDTAGPRRLKEDWYPEGKTLQRAVDLGYQFDDVEHIINEFRSYWIAEKKRRKLPGWEKTFLNRLHSLHLQQQRGANNGKAKSGSQVLADDLNHTLKQQGATL